MSGETEMTEPQGTYDNDGTELLMVRRENRHPASRLTDATTICHDPILRPRRRYDL